MTKQTINNFESNRNSKAAESASVRGVHLTERQEGDIVVLGIKIDTQDDTDGKRAVATLVAPGGQVYYTGLYRGEGEITIPSPNLWWPTGLGVQNLYKLTVNLYSRSEIADTLEIDVGLRFFSQDEGGILVNGVRFIPRGAEYVSESKLPSELTEERAEWLLSDFRQSGFNTVYLSESSTAPEWLYSIADRLGLVVFCDGKEEKFSSVENHASVLLSESAVNSGAAMPLRLGFGSLPAEDTLMTVVDAECANLFSPEVERITDGEGIGLRIVNAMAEEYKYPYTLRELTYVSGLLQASELSSAVEKMRLGRDTGGFRLSRLADHSPLVSESCIDSLGVRKAICFAAQRALAPISAIVEDDGGRVEISISNEREWSFFGTLKYSILDSENNLIFSRLAVVDVPSHSVVRACVSDIRDTIRSHESDYYLAYTLSEGGAEFFEGTHLFTKSKYFNFKQPTFTSEITGTAPDFTLVISSDVFVKDARIDFESSDAQAEQSYVDFTSSMPIRIPLRVPTRTTAQKLLRKLRITSHYDVGRGARK